MAKRKKASGGGGSSIGLILTLIFFVLATFIAGTVAYFGYEEIEGHKAKAAKAEKAAKDADSRYREERVRKVMLRIAMGVEDPEKDRVLLVQEIEALRPEIKDEYDRMKSKLIGVVPDVPDPKDPSKMVSAFYWPLVSMTNQEVRDLARDPETGQAKDAPTLAGDPATRPIKILPDLVILHNDEFRKLQQQANDALAKANVAEDRLAAATTDKSKIEMQFNDALTKIQQETKDKYAKLDTNFNDLVKKHSNDAKNATDRVRDLGAADNAKADQIAALNTKIAQIQELLNKLQDQSAASSKLNAVGVDFTNMEEKKGEVVRKEGGYVVINVGSSKRLKPQVTFLVVGADVSWLTLMEREEALKRNTYRTDRQPFEDNPYVKAGIEVVEVTGPDRSRCKILFENEPIRNPVQARDQIFNLSWQPDEDIRIAFAGIIDLDGDGLDNNEDFLRMLERQGVIVDEYLKMKPLEFVKRDGRGMSLQTKYLVVAPSPRLENIPGGANVAQSPQGQQTLDTIQAMSDIQARAKSLGVQVIEARKFLAMIGYKLPKNPLPPQYGSSAYFNNQAAPPMPEAKKDGN